LQEYGTMQAVGQSEPCTSFSLCSSEHHTVPEVRTNSGDAEKELADDIAVMIPTSAGVGTTDGWALMLRERFLITSEIKLTFCGENHHLYVLRMTGNSMPQITSSLIWSSSTEIRRCEINVKGAFDTLPDGVRIWPLHHQELSNQLLHIDLWGTESSNPHWFQRILEWLHIIRSPSNEVLIESLRNHYGPNVAYCVAWTHIFPQFLWVLSLICSVALLVGAHPDGNKLSLALWFLMLVCVFAWGLAVLVSTARKDRHTLLSLAEGDGEDFGEGDDLSEQFERSFRVVSVVMLPAFIFFVAVTCVLLAVIQLKLWISYIWGDCLHLRLTGNCMYATYRYGMLGWLANLGANILLAIVFLTLGPVARAIGPPLADMLREESSLKTRIMAVRISTALEIFGKIGLFVILALYFVPKWVANEGSANVDCSHMWGHAIFGESWLRCLHSKITVEERRVLFRDAMVGPLVVAPILETLFKSIIPYLVEQLDTYVRHSDVTFGFGFCAACRDQVARLLALIFAYNRKAVGGFGFVVHGWPFKAPKHAVWTDYDKQAALVHHPALQQGIRREFDPLLELLFLKLSWVWMLFFIPVVPWGVFPTLLGWLLEARIKLRSVLLTRRRPFPKGAVLAHKTTVAFMGSVLILSVPWWALLCWLTFDDTAHGFLSIG